jgi:DNA-binding NtrC family response regulator
MKEDRQTDIIGLPFVVIVAEKHPIVRASLAAILSHDGYRVFQAENLNATISCINRITDLDVLVADLDMPGWKSIVRHVLDTAPDALVVAMAGVESIPVISDLNQHGVQVCLQKPVIYKDVRQAISKVIERRRACVIAWDTGDHKKNRVVTTKRIEPAQFDSYARATDNLT